MKKIKIKINKQDISCQEGQTVMQVAHENGIMIPGLCGHPDFSAKANCRLCMVEVRGRIKLQTACTTLVSEGMVVNTENERVKKTRDTNLELIFAEHIEKCADCIWRFQCKLLSFAEKYKILITTFEDRKGKRKTYKFANAVELDGSQCIDCRNCIDACSQLMNINHLKLKGKGVDQEVVPSRKKENQCILCGQCAVHCPVSAAQEQAHWEVVEKHLKKKSKQEILIAQFAPSIRVSIGEDFGLPYGKIVTPQIVSGLRELGFDYVFDVSFAADITTVVEAHELIHRIKNKETLPMITSCCPGWVNYVEIHHPELIPNLTSSRSPHMHGGGIIKTFWARQMKLNPKNIRVVSIMPCTAKKYEAARKEMKIKNMYPVDYVLTTREFSFLLKKNNLDLGKLKKSKADSPLGEHSGGGVIFGGSGGVMESALRAAHHALCGNKKSGICQERIEFKEVRGMKGVKDKVVEVGGTKLRVAVVNGIANVESVIEKLHEYHYIEVMACPGGCIGGGGQPIPTTPAIRKKRAEALYRIDKSKKIRKSSENQAVLDILEGVKESGKGMQNKVLHTFYIKKTNY